ncbi:MAG: hypothetical protein ABI404_10400 [Bradyrhizobium sp.]
MRGRQFAEPRIAVNRVDREAGRLKADNSGGATSMCAATTATDTISAKALGTLLLAMSAFRH